MELTRTELDNLLRLQSEATRLAIDAAACRTPADWRKAAAAESALRDALDKLGK